MIPLNTLTARLAFFLGFTAALVPAVVVRVNGGRPTAPKDLDYASLDLDGEDHVDVLLCLSPEHNDEDDWSAGYTAEWDVISKRLDDAARMVNGSCDNGTIEEDGSGEVWSYRIRAN